MGKTLYFECNAGISGDMTVAALLDLGVEWDYLKSTIDSLPIKGYQIFHDRISKAGISCMNFRVELDPAYENHDHDMEYLHNHSHADCRNDHSHGESLDNHHAHNHDTLSDNHHTHQHRGLLEIYEIIESADLTVGAKDIAKNIFDVLAEAEAQAHGTSKEEVHFHEVGAVDSIIDIVATAVCLDKLNVTDVIVAGVCEGTGSIRCQHGILPIPVPATANIMAKYHLPVTIMPVEGEFVTPTGAAILAACITKTDLPDRFTIQKMGLGAGKRNYAVPSILRIMEIAPEEKNDIRRKNITEDTAEKKETDDNFIVKLESNIDDCSGEVLGYVLELLMEAGARDVHYIPVFMKKNRSGYLLNVICTSKQVETLEDIIFRETTTIGIRRIIVERDVLERSIEWVDTPYGKAQIKRCKTKSGDKIYPEYASVVQLAKQSGKSYHQIFDEIKYSLLQK